MKTFKIVFTLLFFTALFSCVPNQHEKDLQKQKEDSLMEIERNNALDNTEKLLQMTDSLPVENDTTPPVKK